MTVEETQRNSRTNILIIVTCKLDPEAEANFEKLDRKLSWNAERSGDEASSIKCVMLRFEEEERIL